MSFPPKPPPPPKGHAETPAEKAAREKRWLDGKLFVEQLRKDKGIK